MSNEENVIGKIYEVPVDELKPMKNQPRVYFDEDSLKKLANNIKKNGISTPLKITEDKTIISGERRWKAAQLAEIKKVPVIYDTDNIYEKAVVENVMRDDLTAIERAEALKGVYDQQKAENKKLTQKEFGEYYSVKKSTISEIFSIANMDEDIKKMFRELPGASTRELKKIANLKDLKEQKEKAERYLKFLNSNKDKKGRQKTTAGAFTKKIIKFESDLSRLDKKWNKLLETEDDKKEQIEKLKELKSNLTKLINDKKKELDGDDKPES